MVKAWWKWLAPELFPRYSGSFRLQPKPARAVNQMVRIVGRNPGKISKIRRNAPSSRQPLVKGERLVRSELGAAMPRGERGPVQPQCACLSLRSCAFRRQQAPLVQKPAAPKGVPERSPNSVLTGPCAG